MQRNTWPGSLHSGSKVNEGSVVVREERWDISMPHRSTAYLAVDSDCPVARFLLSQCFQVRNQSQVAALLNGDTIIVGGFAKRG